MLLGIFRESTYLIFRESGFSSKIHEFLAKFHFLFFFVKSFWRKFGCLWLEWCRWIWRDESIFCESDWKLNSRFFFVKSFWWDIVWNNRRMCLCNRLGTEPAKKIKYREISWIFREISWSFVIFREISWNFVNLSWIFREMTYLSILWGHGEK